MKNTVSRTIQLFFFAFILIGCNAQDDNKPFTQNTVAHTNDNQQDVPAVVDKPQIVENIPLPEGYTRIAVDSASFGFFLRNIRIDSNNTVYYFNGEKKYSQNLHYAILAFDIGTRDLQQCADAVMRLRAEYLYWLQDYGKIHFNFVSDGKPRYFDKYSRGDYSRKNFRKYLDYIYSYANTRSLKAELLPVDSIQNIMPGDVFIQSGNPYGHAVTVIDVAINTQNDDKIFMVCQSFMPAQSIHILKNLENHKLSPWYSTKECSPLKTPEWTFDAKDLRRFAE
ncbi:MAG: hypothetical protein C0594_12535 [Marinilabiliales bacterium]|nr:MAG: hypothetical protein C0594_12535 [Marinilabiliales bacterium]